MNTVVISQHLPFVSDNSLTGTLDHDEDFNGGFNENDPDYDTQDLRPFHIVIKGVQVVLGEDMV